MPEAFTLALGGVSISLVPDRDEGEFEASGRALDFRSEEKPEITLPVYCGSFPEPGGEEPVFDTGLSWKLYRSGESWMFWNRSVDQDPVRVGVFQPDFRGGAIHVAASPHEPGKYAFPLGYPLGELYIMSLLGTGLGFVAHAAGVIDHGTGYLFAGYGGAGKTTTSRLWAGQAGVQVVNDDKVIVRREAGGFRLYGTPWHGEGGMALPDSAPLRRVFILKHAGRNQLNPLSPAQAAAALLARAFVPLWSAGQMDRVLQLVGELCQSVPCGELGFVPGRAAVDFVRSLD